VLELDPYNDYEMKEYTFPGNVFSIREVSSKKCFVSIKKEKKSNPNKYEHITGYLEIC